MNKKALFIGLVLLLLVGLSIGAAVFFKNRPSAGTILPENVGAPDVAADASAVLALIKKDFSVVPPAGWKEVSSPAGVLLMVANLDENITDPALIQRGFRSYFTVGYQGLEGKSREDFLQFIRDSLNQSFPGIAYSRDEEANFAGGRGQTMEMTLTQGGSPFKVMVTTIWGNNDDAWVISFNTTPDRWSDYGSQFYQVADSFRLTAP